MEEKSVYMFIKYYSFCSNSKTFIFYDNATTKTMKKILSVFSLLLISASLFSQTSANTIPRIIEKNGRHALLVDGKPYFMFGGQAHNSSGWPALMPGVWLAAEKMHLNTLEVPIYWEIIEPEQGRFDFSSIDTLLAQASLHKTHLVLLWFATWKNGSNHYMPEWMKRDAAKYPNIQNEKGEWVDSPSPHSQATLDADKKAFAAVMHYLKKADPKHTVIMVQVENEPGSWYSVRDFSPVAQKSFDGPVPGALLKPEVLKELPHQANNGSWKEVFGNNADEYFHAWHVAHFIGEVAAAGKQEYSLPLYTNAALRDPLTNPKATTYESGGPTDNVLAIYEAAAPALDVFAPDIYLSGNPTVLKVLELYQRADNPLFVPETISSPEHTKYMYEVIARGGIGFSPFGIDDNGRNSPDSVIASRLKPVGQEYAVFAPMMRELAQWSFDGKIKSVVEAEDHAQQTIDLGDWQAVIIFGSGRGNAPQANAQPTGKLMLVQLSNDQFIAIGTHARVTFKPTGKNSGKAWQYLKVEEGRYENGMFKSQRILNGDETDWGGPLFGSAPSVLRISLLTR
jgi:hypothetical protein